MDAVRFYAFLTVTVIVVAVVFPGVAADSIFPFLPPLFGKACEGENACGKGKCVKSDNSTFGFGCECEDGWKQFRPESESDHDGGFFNFLPCIIPNCTLNYTCADAPAPSPASHNKNANLTIFDPCFWTDCGGGHCNSTSPFEHTCLCQEGYSNLFNSTAFPCYRDCSLGLDCVKLGLDVMNRTITNNPSQSVADDNSNGTGLNSRLEFSWLITMLTTWGFFVWIYT